MESRWQRGTTLRTRRPNQTTAATEYNALVTQAWRELDAGHTADWEELKMMEEHWSSDEAEEDDDKEWTPDGEDSSSSDSDEDYCDESGSDINEHK